MLLWLLFAGLTVVVLAALLWPVLRGHTRAAVGKAYDSAVYQDQLKEIDSDHARGLIGDAEAEAAKTEISRRLLTAAEMAQGAQRNNSSAQEDSQLPMLAVLFVLVAVPGLAFALYSNFGSPGYGDRPFASRTMPQEVPEDFRALVRKVEERLRQHPQDGRGWEVIAPVYFRMGRYRDAADAYGRALRLLGENTDRLLGWGESVVYANDGTVDEVARAAFEKVIQREGFRPKANFWLAMAKEQAGAFSDAAAEWRRMLSRATQGSSWKEMVEQRLQLVERKTAGESVPLSSEETAGQPGPSREDIASAQQMTESERSEMINQMVQGLAERLKEDGKNLQGWLRLVRAYSVLGKHEKARAALKSAQENFKEDKRALAELSTLAGNLGL